MTILAIISKNLKRYAEEVPLYTPKTFSLFGEKKASKPNLLKCVFFELSGLIHEGMNCQKIEAVLTVLESIPEFSKKRTKPLNVANSEALDKDMAAVLAFWNRIFKQVRLPELSKFDIEVVYKRIETHFNYSDFYSDETPIKRFKEIYDFLLPMQVAIYETNSDFQCVNTQRAWEFSHSMSVLKTKTALSDFNRDVELAGYSTQEKSNEEILKVIAIFVVGENRKPSSKEQKIIEFLIHNGGQDMNRFFELEIMSSLKYKENNSQITFGLSQGKQIWHKDPKSGIFYLDIDQDIYCLIQDEHFIINQNNKEIVLDDPEKMKHLVGMKASNRAPLLKGQARIRLDFNKDDQIIPVIESMRMHLHASPALRAPEFIPVSTARTLDKQRANTSPSPWARPSS